MRYCAFDIEIVKKIPDGTADWKALRPLGISCAATLVDGEAPMLWYHGADTGAPLGGALDTREAGDLVRYLMMKAATGTTVLTFNGLGFDFDVLAEESGLRAECATLALGHVDMMFDVFCRRGHAVALDRAAKGMGLPGKPEGMTGALAPDLWAEGRYVEVLDYVQSDANNTLMLAHAVDDLRELRWTSRRGNPITCPIPAWLTVSQALALPLPDTSYMTDPWPRAKFTGWLAEYLAPSVAG